MKIRAVLALATIALVASGCSKTSSAPVQVPFIDTESAAVKSVKNGSVQGCPLSTLGDMADGFFGSPEWSDFTSVSGQTVVELRGGMTYDNMPVDALIQFTVDSLGGFEIEYLEIGGVPQNKLILAALINKMCDAA